MDFDVNELVTTIIHQTHVIRRLEVELARAQEAAQPEPEPEAKPDPEA